MQNINIHLAYLLTKHECVIIPDFGAFVVSPVQENNLNQSNILLPPIFTLAFNSELKHNDGLLANSISREKSISYKEANLLIQRYVSQNFAELNNRKTLCIPWIGSLTFSPDKKIIFKPALYLSCNAINYGFTNFHLPYLNEIQKKVTIQKEPIFKEKNTKDRIIWAPLNRKFITYTGSIAAGLLALFLISTPLNNLEKKGSTQSASILPVSVKIIKTAKPQVKSTVTTIDTTLSISKTQVEPEIAEKVSSRQYFIVIASLPDRKSAEDTLDKFKIEGFKDVSIISSEGKHRIYVNKFTDKKDAESYLINFRKENPKHAKAWLLGQNF